MIKDKLKHFTKKITNGRRRIALASIAAIIVLLATLAPIHVTNTLNPNNTILTIGQGKYTITIGNVVSAQEADYTCDGIADDVQFQQALDALPNIGGQLFVYAGSYNWTANTTVTRAIDNVSIIGVGASVYFAGDGSTPIFTAGGDRWLFTNFRTDAGSVATGATSNWMELHVTLGGTYYPLRTDSINIEDHSALHGVGGSDTVFPADPNADKYLMWDDDPGQLSWGDAGTGEGDMLKSTYDTDEDGDIDTAAGGTEWDSSATTGVVYITAGAWGTKDTGIANTYILIVDDADAADNDFAKFTAGGLEGRDYSEVRGDLGLVIGTDIQAYDAELAAIAGLTSAADKVIYFTGSGTADVSDLTAFARSILDDANEATFKATVNLEIGTDVAAQTHASQHAVGGSDTVFPTDPNGDKFLMWDDDPGQLSWESRGGGGDMLKSTYDTDDDGDIDTAAGGTEWDSSGATGVAYITGGNWSAVSKGIANGNFIVIDGDPNDDEYARFTANGLEGRTEAEFKADFNLEIGTDVLAYDATLASIANLGTGADKMVYATGVDTWAETGLTAFARSILDDADEATFKATVNLEIGTDVLAQQTIGIADDNLVEMDDTDAADNDYAKFTANGLEGRSYSELLGDLSGQASAAFSLNSQALEDVCCENGSTFPASPADGMWFRHQPTGRDILYQYDGATSAWKPIIAFGVTTLYVDTADGTDDLDHGTAVDSDAFDTVQYALDVIPRSTLGSVIIYIAEGSYTEDIDITAKAGNYISLQGTLSLVVSDTATGGTQGATTTTPKVSGNFDANEYDNKIIKFTSGSNDGLYRIIGLTTTTNLCLVGEALTVQPQNGDTYEIYDWGTTITGLFDVSCNGAIISLSNLNLTRATGSYTCIIWGYQYYGFNRCKIDTTGASRAITIGQSDGTMYCSLVTLNGNQSGIYLENGAGMEINGTRICGAASNQGTGIWATLGSRVGAFRWGSEIEDVNVGIRITGGSSTGMSWTPAVYSNIHGCSYGLYAEYGGTYYNTSYIQYGVDLDGSADANSSANESPSGASDPAYID